jgi:dolichol-phosphate mannosyltransferase
MLGLAIHDCTGGFRCYRRELLQQIPWDEIHLEGYGFQIGVIHRVQSLGKRVVEFPIIFEDRRVGQSKMSFKIVIEAFAYVTRMALSGKKVKRTLTTESASRL